MMSANLLRALRTGAMPAMAAIYLANPDAKVLSIIGPGAISKEALRCYMEVLSDIEEIKLRGSTEHSKSALDMKAYIEKEYPKVKKITLCASLEEACRDADVVSEAMSVTKQDMEEFKPEWFKKGATVFSLGSFLIRDFEKLSNMKMVADNYGMYEKYMKNFLRQMKILWANILKYSTLILRLSGLPSQLCRE